MKNKFYEFKNIADNEYSLYIYGEIMQDKTNLFAMASENDVDINDFKEALSGIPNGAKLNMYVNSPGGSVFACSTMISMLQRAKDRGIKIDAYIDGVACSCASWLIMIADNINVYPNSVMMVHKPIVTSYGNANDLAKDIEVLNKLEDSVIVPLYEKKAKIDRQKIKSLMEAETWLTASEIKENFNVTFIDEAKNVQNIKSDLFSIYKNTPKEFTQVEKPVENMADTSPQEKIKEDAPKVDYSAFEQTINELVGVKNGRERTR